MCYSAMVREQFDVFVHVTGAKISLPEFARLYVRRAAGENIRIPRGLDRNFELPRTPLEQEIREAIDRYRTAQVAGLEQELFAQRRRLADAERKLGVKVTKAATDSRRIATNRVEAALKRLPLLKDFRPHAADDRIFPFHFVPIVMRVNGENVVRPARYHLRQPGQPASIDRKFPGLYNARRDNLTRFWRHQFGVAHALMLVDSFYENVDREGRNVVLHFTPQPAGLMYVACLVAQWQDPSGKEPDLLSFAAVTDDPPPEVAAAGHDRMILNLDPQNIERWLTPEGRSLAELQAILDARQRPFYQHEQIAA